MAAWEDSREPAKSACRRRSHSEPISQKIITNRGSNASFRGARTVAGDIVATLFKLVSFHFFHTVRLPRKRRTLPLTDIPAEWK